MNFRLRIVLDIIVGIAVVLIAGGALRAEAPKPKSEAGAKKQKIDPLDAYFDSGPLPRLHIELNPDDLQRLDGDPKTYIRAQIRESAPGENDRQYRDVGLHLKGGFGSIRPVADKPALTLNFDKFVSGQNFHGMDKLHLNNSVQDASYMCENIGGWVFRESGVPAPRVSAAHVWLNGRDLGIFVLKEGFDAPFYKRFFEDRAGDLYDGNFTDVNRTMAVHLGEHKLPAIDPADPDAAAKRENHLNELRTKAWRRLGELAAACEEIDPQKRHERLDAVLDVDRFLTFLACETMVAHWDGYATNRNNYRIYHDAKTDRLVFLPHGMDQLFQRPEHSLYGNNSLVALAFTINNDADRKRYLQRIAEIRKGAFKTEAITAQLARIADRIKPMFEEIGPQALAEHGRRTEILRKRIIARCEAIDRQLANEPRPLQFDASGAATLGKWWPMHQDDGGDAAADQFEEGGKPRLRVTCKAPGGTASWRTNELMTPGTYTFSARMKLIGVTPARTIADALGGGGACLRASGSRHSERYTGDSDWQTVSYTFSVTQPIREVIFICELSAGGGQAIFDPASMKVRRQRGTIPP